MERDDPSRSGRLRLQGGRAISGQGLFSSRSRFSSLSRPKSPGLAKAFGFTDALTRRGSFWPDICTNDRYTPARPSGPMRPLEVRQLARDRSFFGFRDGQTLLLTIVRIRAKFNLFRRSRSPKAMDLAKRAGPGLNLTSPAVASSHKAAIGLRLALIGHLVAQGVLWPQIKP
jgi:hypothetical protein